MTETKFYLFTNPEDLVKKTTRYFFRLEDRPPLAQTKILARLIEKALTFGASLVKDANMYLLAKRTLHDASQGERLSQPIETFEYVAETAWSRVVEMVVGRYDAESRALCETTLDQFFRTLWLPPTLETPDDIPETESPEVPEIQEGARASGT